MKVILGPLPCASCRAPVTVVRRPVVILGHGPDCPKKIAHDYCYGATSEELVEVVTTDPEGGRHHCADFAIARLFEYNGSAGASGQPNRLNVAPVSQLAPGVRASFHVGSKTT